MTTTIAGIKIPDSSMARAATELVRDTEPDLLFNHSRRVYLFGALAGERKMLKYDPELLYIGAMFHDMGLVDAYSSQTNRFEVDGANAARDFLKQYGANEYDIEQVWTSIALHTTPGVPEHMKPVVALVTAGVEMDVLGLAFDEFSEAQRLQVVAAHPREQTFKNDIIDAFAHGTIRKPDTTFGNVKADVLELRDPTYRRLNFCQIILGSAWDDSTTLATPITPAADFQAGQRHRCRVTYALKNQPLIRMNFFTNSVAVGRRRDPKHEKSRPSCRRK